MVSIENDCVSCDLPCTNCGLKHSKHYYCDKCDEEVDKLYILDGRELCKDCVLDELEVVS